MSSLWENLISRYLRFAELRPGLILLVALLLSLGGLSLSQRIYVDPSLEALLPADSPALPAIEEMQERIPGSSPLYLLVKSEDPDLTRRMARKVMEGVSSWPETIYALDRRDPTYFLDRRLLFLPEKDITDLAYQVEDIVDFEECKAMPGCVNLDDRPEDPTEESLREKFDKVPEVKALLGLFGMSELPKTEENKDPSAKPGGGDKKAAEGARLGDLCSADGKVCAVQAILKGSPSDLTYAENILDKAQTLFDRIRPADAPESLQLETSGRYRNTPMNKKLVVSDLRNTALLSTSLMLLLSLLQFRGFRPFVLIFVPLLCAAAWSAGVIALVHPQLNVISAFTLAVLAGLGIDFGVHMLTQYGTERSAGHVPSIALERTFEKLAGPMGVACLTTACGFGALLAAKFRGFAEMGGLAALGVALALLAFLLLFAPLVHLSHRIFAERGAVIRTYALRFPRIKRPRVVARSVALAGAAIAVACAVVGTQVGFEYDFRKLSAKTVGHGINYGKAMHSTTRLSVVMMAETPKALEATAQALREAHPEHKNDAQAWLLTPASFVPPEQDGRLAAIKKLKAAVARAEERLKKEDRAQLDHVRPLLNIDGPITPEALPQWVREWLTERNGNFGTFGLMYSDLRGSDARAMEQLADELAELRKTHPEVLFGSAEALLGLVIPGLRADAPTMLSLALLGLFIGTLVIGRSLKRTLLVMSPIAVATSLSLAIMVGIDLRVNLYNMLVFPLSFGIGIDGAVYVVWAMIAYTKDTPKELSVTARGVLGSTTTTAAGFGSMIVASNPGLVSLGELSLVTLGCSLLANLVWLPALMYWLFGPREEAATAATESKA